MAVTEGIRCIVGGVDTHKDLHVAAVIDEQDRVIGTRSFATTRQGYRQVLAWMRALALIPADAFFHDRRVVLNPAKSVVRSTVTPRSLIIYSR